MAITLKDTFSSKNRHHCVSNRVDVLFKSDFPEVTIFLSGSNRSNILQFKADVNADGFVYKDFAEIIKRQLTFDFKPCPLQWFPASSSTVNIAVTAVENVSGATGATSLISAATIENSFLFKDDWIESTHKENKFVFPVIMENHFVRLNDQFIFHVNRYDKESKSLLFKTYNDAGFVQNYTLNAPDFTFQRNMVDCGPQNLVQVFGTNFLDPNITRYTVELKSSGGTTQSLVHTFNLDLNCYANEPVRLHWLNSRGGFDAFNFTMGTKETRKNLKSSYQRLDYSINANTIQDSTINSYSNFVSKSRVLTCTSDWVNEAQSNSLIELFESSVVIWEKGNTFYSVSIDGNEQEKKSYLNNLIFNYEVKIDLNDMNAYTI